MKRFLDYRLADEHNKQQQLQITTIRTPFHVFKITFVIPQTISFLWVHAHPATQCQIIERCSPLLEEKGL